MDKKLLLLLLFISFNFHCFSQDKVLHERIKKEGTYLVKQNNRYFEIDTTIITIKLVEGKKLSRDYGIKKRNKLGYIDIKVPKGVSFESFVQKLKGNNNIRIIEYSVYGEYHDFIPDDDYISSQWYLDRINMFQAWEISTGNSNISIAVIDSGVDWSHDDIGLGNDSYQNIFLNSNEDAWNNPDDPSSGNGIDDDNNGLVDDWKGWNYDANSNDTRTSNPHGTFVAGIISAKTNNGEGIAGIAGGNNNPGIQVLPYCIGVIRPNSSVIDDAIIDAVDKGVRVIQLSLSVIQSSSIDSAIQYAVNNDVVIVCSSGNTPGGGISNVSYPASNANVIAVGSVDQNDQRANFSNFGGALDVVAPGTGIYSSGLNDSYYTDDGTSFSSPQVSALAGLLFSVDPNLTQQQVSTL